MSEHSTWYRLGEIVDRDIATFNKLVEDPHIPDVTVKAAREEDLQPDCRGRLARPTALITACCDPVHDNADVRTGAWQDRIHQEPLPILRHVIIDRIRGIGRPHLRLEQCAWHSVHERGARRDGHDHQPAIGREKEQLASVARPDRLRPAVCRYLMPRARGWKRVNDDLPAATLIRGISDPTVVRREAPLDVLGYAVKERRNAAGLERERRDV